MSNPKETVLDVAARVLADPASSPDARACAEYAREQSNWLAKIIARGVKAAEGRE